MPHIKNPSAIRPGDRILGRFVCEKLLGEGGMSLVFLVSDEGRGGGREALKLLKTKGMQRDWPRLLCQEFENIQRLCHPGFVEVHEMGFDPGSGLPFFTMEPLVGTGLLQACRDGGVIKLAAILGKALEALDFLHGHGLLHYDLKPSNIFVTEGGRVVLMDLALAGPPGRSTIHKGTPAYAAPVMICRRHADAWLDLYSLGASLYHCLASRPPFRGTIHQVLAGHLYRLPGPLALWGRARILERFAFRLMAKDPKERFPTAAAALTWLRRHRPSVPES